MNATLDVISRTTARGIIIEVAGELDLTTVKVFEEPLAEGIRITVSAAEAAVLSVDLRRVDFIDSAGLAVLVTARKRLASAKRSIQILLTQGQQPDRVLKLGCFDRIMTLSYREF